MCVQNTCVYVSMHTDIITHVCVYVYSMPIYVMHAHRYTA